MMRNFFLLLLAVATLLLSAAGCRDKTPTTSLPAAASKPTRNAAIAACADKGLAEFRTLSLSGKAVADIPGVGEGVGLSYRIAIERDKAILIRVNKLIEVARVYITPDSIVTLDRLNNVAYITGFGVARTYTGLDADFALLQDLLTGSLNVIPDTMNLSGNSNGVSRYTGLYQGVSFEYDVAEDDCRPRRLEAKNAARQQHTRIAYTEFLEVEKTLFAKAVSIDIFEPKKAAFALTHHTILPNEPDFAISFSVPDGYTIQRDLSKP